MTRPPDRPAVYDEEGWRIGVHPAIVRGIWRKRREWTQVILLLIFLTLPWVRIHGSQALLLDVSRRQFEIFGLSLRAHNAPLLLFVLAIAGFGLFLVTAIWGRVWCGWACPQTVFIESVYRRIESWIEGNAVERRRLMSAPWSKEKAFKKVMKWLAFLAVSLVITHSFLAYFVGIEELASMIRRPPHENWTSFLFMAFSTAIILFNFGWFREQFCMIACPYGRFQSVLMDSRSMIVGYDAKRGEPRRVAGQDPGAKGGDCVACNRCVQVCPTGIDIRNGLQMECIACTACIDACDDIMTKVKKPTGLIRYATLKELDAGASIEASVRNSFRPRFRLNLRTGVYLTVIVISAAALVHFVAFHTLIDIQVLRGTGMPYQVVDMPESPSNAQQGTKRVLNQYFLEATNSDHLEHSVQVIAESDVDVTLVPSPVVAVLRPGKTERVGFFVTFDPKALAKVESHEAKVRLRFKNLDKSDAGGSIIGETEIRLVGPINGF